MSKTLLLLVTLVMGALLPIQAALNGKLMRTFGHPGDWCHYFISYRNADSADLCILHSVQFQSLPDQGNTMVSLDRRFDWRHYM